MSKVELHSQKVEYPASSFDHKRKLEFYEVNSEGCQSDIYVYLL